MDRIELAEAEAVMNVEEPIHLGSLKAGVKVLVCGVSADRMEEITRFLSAFEYEPIPVRSPGRALEAAAASQAQIVIWLETDATARRGVMLDAARMLSTLIPGTESILVGPADEPEYAAAAFRAGAYNCLSWPLDYANLARDLALLGFRATRRREQSLWTSRGNAVTFEGMVGSSLRMAVIYEQLQRLALTADPVLITGPVGAGKELVASALHSLAEKAGINKNYQPMMVYRCCGLTEDRAAELFGEQGVLGPIAGDARPEGEAKAEAVATEGINAVELLGFTRPGVLLLDEISDLPRRAQQKLASWILVRKAVRKDSPVRIVATSRFELGQGEFHPGLLRLLAKETIQIPALRDRVEDIPLLVQHFLSRRMQGGASGEVAASIPEISPEAQQVLLRHNWPGNVRELENVIFRAAMLAKLGRIELQDLNISAPPKPPLVYSGWTGSGYTEVDGAGRPAWLN